LLLASLDCQLVDLLNLVVISGSISIEHQDELAAREEGAILDGCTFTLVLQVAKAAHHDTLICIRVLSHELYDDLPCLVAGPVINNDYLNQLR